MWLLLETELRGFCWRLSCVASSTEMWNLCPEGGFGVTGLPQKNSPFSLRNQNLLLFTRTFPRKGPSTLKRSLWHEGRFGVAGLIWLWETVHAKSSRVASIEDCRGRSHLGLLHGSSVSVRTLIMTPETDIVGGLYSIWHNVYNSWQLYRTGK